MQDNKLGFKTKKYKFLEPVTIDDKNWRKEHREQWARDSKISHQSILAKYQKKQTDDKKARESYSEPHIDE